MVAPERLTLRNVYLYLVCLITLVVSIFAAVQLVRSAVGIAYPDPGYYGYYPEDPEMGMDEDEVRRQEELAEDSLRRQEILDVVGAGTTLLIAGPLYLYHWRRVQSELPPRPAPAVPAGPPVP
ncbi:hypothetical protein DQ237_17420 [Blastococcus sp. TF02-8]|uniref:hypothetical protein n=1 Tax=Blastococcus sp. TF02-8 TaxID=2250574 RepID=UPI000DEB84D6|nr:hypothetical protein [Blastococcus sp. TF02-8]RBY93564.1 hypothetical protein DQ237_17420 [Blastococcus sp. TF02-8]